MDKRRLSSIPRETASEDMLEIAGRLGGMEHIVTAQLIENDKILLLYFYEIAELRKRKSEAAFRTFLSTDDYITQDLKTQKVRWKTASFCMMDNFSLWESHWNEKKDKFDYTELVFIRTNEEQKIISDFLKDYDTKSGKLVPWDRVYAFQEAVKEKRLAERYKKETDVIDIAMAPIKDVPKEFYDWVWEEGMKFSRYLIYTSSEKEKAECECTYCKKAGVVDRKVIRLRNNEKGKCPFCGSPVTIKARGRIAYQNRDERWFAYIDPTEEGFVFRYFHAVRNLRSDKYILCTIDKNQIVEYISEYSRAIYTFPQGKPACTSYEWGKYKQRGESRWCPDMGKINCMECILYPGNLPHAWAHTPMKYSGLEYLSSNASTSVCRYEDAIKVYLKYPKLEWICKMGLNHLAIHLIDYEYRGYSYGVGKVNLNANTIYHILGLNKVNTRILQQIDGGTYHLRLLQVAESIGLQFKPEQLKEYYDTFECNTDLLKESGRKVSLYKILKYIAKESERYPKGECGCCMSSYIRYHEPEDSRIERMKNMAKDWLEYLEWCKKLKYDLNNMFFYMPKDFKKVHDRTAKEYQALLDKKAAAEKKRQENLAKNRMEQMQKAMEEIFKKNAETDAFYIKGKGLILVVPKNGDEIKAEGEALHHCVGNYVARVAKGETNIFFIRKEDAPNIPYFTLEYNNNHVVQCRGTHNCDMPPDVKAFVKVFEKKMQEAVKKQNKVRKHRKAG